MKKGDWIKIDFTGRMKATGEVFDLTSEEVAKKEGVHDPKKKYGPVLTIVGAGMIIPGVERELLKMKPGEEKEFEVKPENALGPRRPEFVKIFSIAKFTREKITPFPGMWINIDGRNAKVQSVAGGRVRIDFNHPLAGKELRYAVKIVEEVKGTKSMVDSLLEYYGAKGKTNITGKRADIIAEKDVNPMTKKLIEETLKKWCPGVDSVNFVPEKGKPEASKSGKEKIGAGKDLNI